MGLVGPQGRSGQVRKILPPPGFDPRTVQPVTSRYTGYATRQPYIEGSIFIIIYIYTHTHTHDISELVMSYEVKVCIYSTERVIWTCVRFRTAQDLM